jgi:hypothetical protein
MPMSAQHKAALAKGRRESHAVKRYLEALGNRRPGRPVTPERLRERIADLGARIEDEQDLLKALEMRQQRIDAEVTLAKVEAAEDMSHLEDAFVKHAKAFSERKGISYSAWRQSGVPAEILRRAGIAQTRSRRS